ncbi:hypothetical protein RB594_006947 [Gaeumannomyces avenae]
MIVVAIRLRVRLSARCLGPEDVLICAALVPSSHSFHIFRGPTDTISSALVGRPPTKRSGRIWCLFRGRSPRGGHNKRSCAQKRPEARLHLPSALYQLLGSHQGQRMCRTAPSYRLPAQVIFLVFLIGHAVAAAVAFLAGVLAQCSPIQAVWTGEQELCHNTAVVAGGFYLVSAVSIIADTAVAIISVVILGHVRIPKVVKRFVAVILSLGVLASVCTIIRLTYLPSYPRGGGDIRNIGPIVLLSILETSIAIISASLPMLCKLLGTVPRPSTYLGGAGIDLSTKTIRWNTEASPGHISLMELAPTSGASSTIEPNHDHHLATTTAGTRDTFCKGASDGSSANTLKQVWQGAPTR